MTDQTESTPSTLDHQITLQIVNEALTCARQRDQWRKPYAAIVSPSGDRQWINSLGRSRSLLEDEATQEFTDLLQQISTLAPGYRVECRNATHCSHKYECRTVWTRTRTAGRKKKLPEGTNMGTKFDPQLHLLRTVVRSLPDARQRHEAETARFHLFAALQTGDTAAANQWLIALQATVQLSNECDVPEPTRSNARAALAAIARSLKCGE